MCVQVSNQTTYERPINPPHRQHHSWTVIKLAVYKCNLFSRPNILRSSFVCLCQKTQLAAPPAWTHHHHISNNSWTITPTFKKPKLFVAAPPNSDHSTTTIHFVVSLRVNDALWCGEDVKNLLAGGRRTITMDVWCTTCKMASGVAARRDEENMKNVIFLPRLAWDQSYHHSESHTCQKIGQRQL